VEFPNGLPTVEHGLVIVEVFERVEFGPDDNYPLEFDGTPITYFSVNDFLNLTQELRTLLELLTYLQARRSLPAGSLRTIGDEKSFFEYYLLSDGSFNGYNDHVDIPEFIRKNKRQLDLIIAAKHESDRYSHLIEYVAGGAAPRLRIRFTHSHLLKVRQPDRAQKLSSDARGTGQSSLEGTC